MLERVWRKGNPLTLLVGMQTSTATMENSVDWCFWTVVLEKTPESPLDCKEIQPVHPKGDQSWVFIRRTDVEAETTILWPPDVTRWLIGKDPDGGKDWGQKKGTTEDEMVGWYHWLNGHEFEWTLGVCDGQGGLACCFMGLQRVRHDWVTELNWPEPYSHKLSLNFITEHKWMLPIQKQQQQLDFTCK